MQKKPSGADFRKRRAKDAEKASSEIQKTPRISNFFQVIEPTSSEGIVNAGNYLITFKNKINGQALES